MSARRSLTVAVLAASAMPIVTVLHATAGTIITPDEMFHAQPNDEGDHTVHVRISRPVRIAPAGAIDAPMHHIPGVSLGDHGASAPFVFTGSAPEGDAPSGVAFTPDGQTIVVAHRESRNLILWDADTRVFVAEIPVSGFAQAVAITPDGATAVVALLDDAISIVNLTTMTEAAVIPAAENPGTVAISPAGDLAAVGLAVSGQIAVVDLNTNTIVRTISGIGYTQTLAVAPEPPAGRIDYSDFVFVDDNRVLNLDRFNDAAQFINVRTGSVNNVTTADQPAGLSIAGDGDTAVVAHAGSARTILRINIATETVASTISTSDDLSGPIATNMNGTRAAAAIQNAARVYDLNTGVAGASLSTASINEMLPTPDRQFVLGVGFRGAVINLANGTLVSQVNNVVSTDFGAMSPTGPRAAMFSTTFGDDMVVVNANGGAGFLEAFQLSGPLDEGDRCRTVAISADGATAVGVSILSDSAAIVDVTTGAVTGIATVGQRPSAVAITPDATKAVVGNLDSSFVSIVDLTNATTTNVNISTRAGSVAVSPDGQFAYVGVVSGGDGVWRVNLNTNTVAGPKILTGNMGGVGYSFSQSSQIALSPDGSVLAVAGSFDDVVTLIDTANWVFFTNVALPAGSFPTNLSFSPNGEALYVANRNADTVSDINLTLAVPVVQTTWPVGDSPWQVIGLDDGFVVNDWGNERIRRVRTNGPATVRTLPERAVSMQLDPITGGVAVTYGNAALTLDGPVGFSITQNGTLDILNLDTLMLIESVDLGEAGPSAAAVAGNGNVAVSAPLGDGVVVIGRASVCVADFNGDGVVNILDVVTFINNWNAMGPGSDFNADGNINILDVVSFINAWQVGCP